MEKKNIGLYEIKTGYEALALCSLPLPGERENMNEEVGITYCGQRLMVTKEVAEFLAKDRKDRRNEARTLRRHIDRMDPDTVLDTKRCTGRNYLLNVVRDNERRWIVRDIVETFTDNMQRLYDLRYEKDMTQQAIANVEGVSKMAICKRLKKLHEKVKTALPDWPEEEFIIEK